MPDLLLGDIPKKKPPTKAVVESVALAGFIKRPQVDITQRYLLSYQILIYSQDKLLFNMFETVFIDEFLFFISFKILLQDKS